MCNVRPGPCNLLYRWREQVEDQLDETVAFVQSAAETARRSLTSEAARVLEERGVDAALELLSERLREEGQRHKARAREFAEAALFKAELHQTRFEFPQAEAALEQAIEMDHGWWKSHNRLGMLALERADWDKAEQAFAQARLLVTEPTDESAALNNLAQLLKATNRLGEAESLVRRALAIDEASYGPDHPDVARVLNNLAQLLEATNRLGEAEPLMRRSLVVVLKFTRDTGHRHTHLPTFFGNYRTLLQTLELPEGEPERRIRSLGPEAGFDEADFRELLEDL